MLVPLHLVADVVELDRGAIDRRAGHRDLEFSRQEQEFRVERRPLAKDFRIGPRVGDLVGGDAGEMVGGDVADAVPGSLDGVHLDRREVGEDVRHVLQLRPVELQVLPRGEVAVALVVLSRDVREHPHLLRAERAVGHRDPEHVGVELQVDAVLQAERLELVLVELAGQPPRDLVAELRDAFLDEGVIEFVVAIHDRDPQAASSSTARSLSFECPVVGPSARICSRSRTGTSRAPTRVTSIA